MIKGPDRTKFVESLSMVSEGEPTTLMVGSMSVDTYIGMVLGQ